MTIVHITSRSNPRIKALVKKLKTRFDAEWIGVEGPKLIGEAMRAGLSMAEMWSTQESDLQHVDCGYLVSDHVYQLLSQTKSSRPPLAIFPAPALKAISNTITSGRFLVMDRIQEPGNAGAMVRAAAAFGIDEIWWLQPCVYPFQHACIRASAGSIFHLEHRIVNSVNELPKNLPVIGADAHQSQSLLDYQWPRSFALALGNEGSGLSPDVQARLNQRVHIPTSGRVESLNVSGAAHILLYHALGKD